MAVDFGRYRDARELQKRRRQLHTAQHVALAAKSKRIFSCKDVLFAHVHIAADVRVHRAPRDSWPPHVERDADIEIVVVLLALPDAEEPKVVPTASKVRVRKGTNER